LVTKLSKSNKAVIVPQLWFYVVITLTLITMVGKMPRLCFCQTENCWHHALQLVDQPLPTSKGRVWWGLGGQILRHLRRHLLPKTAIQASAAQKNKRS
jgi:hypothetical protein